MRTEWLCVLLLLSFASLSVPCSLAGVRDLPGSGCRPITSLCKRSCLSSQPAPITCPVPARTSDSETRPGGYETRPGGYETRRVVRIRTHTRPQVPMACGHACTAPMQCAQRDKSTHTRPPPTHMHACDRCHLPGCLFCSHTPKGGG